MSAATCGQAQKPASRFAHAGYLLLACCEKKNMLSTSNQDQMLGELNRFVSDFEGTGDLERLEDALTDFNLFVAMGAINTEVKHSNFLAWLLDPNSGHGLGEIVVKRLIQRALFDQAHKSTLTPVDLDLMDLSDLDVRREWSDIDILLVSNQNHIAIAIENKIGASESAGQLQKYKEQVAKEFPNESSGGKWKHILIFLTIEGLDASDASYSTLSYATVVGLLESILKNRGESISPDVAMGIRHYTQMMRRHHMEDSELIGLARRIYLKHRPALDFIFDHRPDAWSGARDILLKILSQDQRLTIDPSTEKRALIRFLPKSWSTWESHLSQGTGWATQGSNQILLCEIKPNTKHECARLQLVLGPGPKSVRETIFGAVKADGIYNQSYYPVWTTLITKSWRTLQNASESNPEQGAQNILKDIEAFLAEDSPRVEAALSKALQQA